MQNPRMQGCTMSSATLIDQIYEAAVMPERWPVVLEAIAKQVGARGGTLGRHAHADPRMIHSENIGDLISGWIAGGYYIDNQRGGALQHIDYAGFVTDHDIHSAEVRATMPCYRDYLTPIGADHGAGTAITGVRNERLVVTIEVFPDAATMQASIPMLDSLRPHIGRAVVLASELQLRECVSAVDALDRVGTGAAFLGSRGQVIAANPSFAEQLGTALLDMRDRLRLSHRLADAALGKALAPGGIGEHGASIALRDEFGIGVAALHLIPVRRMAQEFFAGAATIALVARPALTGAPDCKLIQTLFDLTPTEASVARAIADGQSVEAIARDTKKSVETVRSHLKRIFSKTSTGRQNELALLLRGFAQPPGA